MQLTLGARNLLQSTLQFDSVHATLFNVLIQREDLVLLLRCLPPLQTVNQCAGGEALKGWEGVQRPLSLHQSADDQPPNLASVSGLLQC